jgi:hypothetical protein
MKPAWDKLMEGDYGAGALVGDVDCTAAGKPLCDSNGVKGFPTIKWGDPASLEDYKGGRDFDALDKFASENLKPVCSPANIDLCDDTKKAEIEKFQAMSADELAAAIKGKEDENETAESDFKKFVEGLQKQYEEAMKKKDDAIAAVKASGLGLMKAVKAHAAKAGQDEL